MLVKCTICKKEFENGELKNSFGQYVKSGKKICSLDCEIIAGKARSKKRREKLHFDSKREDILKRDNYECSFCRAKESLVVHHKDKNGRGSNKPNNDFNNLITLCQPCHVKLHQTKYQDIRRINIVIDNWPLSNRAIAKIIGCSHPTVATLRKIISST